FASDGLSVSKLRVCRTIETEKQMNVSNTTPDWSAVKRILFRFAFVYLALYTLCAGNTLPRLFQGLWDVVVPRVGAQVFGVSIPAWQSIGSGDTTFDYVQ